MSEPVPCPACGTATPVEPRGAARCAGCGLLVPGRARPRVRAERATDPADRNPYLPVWIAGALVIVAACVAAFWYHQRVEADRAAAQARFEEMRAADMRRAEQERTRARRAELAALPLELIAADPLPAAVAIARAADLGKTLIGTWRGPGADGGTRVVEYRADGTFRDAVTGPGAREWVGTWAAGGLTGTRVLRLTRTGAGPPTVRLTFEGDELIHDDAPGRATVLRRSE